MADWMPDVGTSSDDSGVELGCTSAAGFEPGAIHGGATSNGGSGCPGGRKNKRKSSEPRHRREVLQMKKFRWDSDASSDTDRPSSGDSGIRTDSNPDNETPTPCLTERLSDVSSSSPPPSASSGGRQSVIRKPNNRVKSSSASIRVVDSRTCNNNNSSSSRPNNRASTSSSPSSSRLVASSSTGYNGSLHLPTSYHSVKSEMVAGTTGGSTTVLEIPRPSALVCGDSNTTDSESAVAGPSGFSGGSIELLPPSQRGGRNYKSMSRQRRIEANARERTRVHTISAAFESLRRAVPAYADNQKLSKLAILRIASAYILALACLNDEDYSKNGQEPSFSDCVDLCTRTIQSEGKARRRSKDSLDLSS